MSAPSLTDKKKRESGDQHLMAGYKADNFLDDKGVNFTFCTISKKPRTSYKQALLSASSNNIRSELETKSLRGEHPRSERKDPGSERKRKSNPRSEHGNKKMKNPRSECKQDSLNVSHILKQSNGGHIN